jgi:multiple sugar transport system permease protein/raffinose/stachyose/melibiose transport system permease protein
MIVWKFAGFSMVIFLAALSSLPEELLDAARIDGANYWQVLRYIIVPLLRVVIVNLFILSWIGKMVQFALVWVTTRGGPVYYTETIATYVQKRAFEWRTLDLGYPSALAVLWFLVVFIGALILNRLLQAEEILEY